MDKFDKAVDRLEANGFVFKGASGIHGRYYEKVSNDKVELAYLFASGAVRYSVEKNYTEWDDFEAASVVYGKVKSGEWSCARFNEWFNHAYSVIASDNSEQG